MNTPDTSEFLPLLEQAARDGSPEGREILESAIEVLPIDGAPMPDGTPFDIEVLLNSGGTVDVATTRKVPNLRFRLGEVMLEVIGLGVKVPGALNNPISTVLSALSFVRNIRKLATIELAPGDAELVIRIFQLTRDRKILGIDSLISATPHLSESQRAEALARLEQLACIKLEDGTVQMNEIIIVRRK